MRIRGWMALLLSAVFAFTVVPTSVAKPPATNALITVPAVQRWQPSNAKPFTWRGKQIVVPAGDAELAEVATTFAADVAALTGQRPQVAAGHARPGTIALARGAVGHGEEGYAMSISKTLTITADTAHGAFNGTRTVLQLLAQGPVIPAGTVTDWPDKQVRSVLVDNTPRHFSMGWWHNLFSRMSYYKLNDTNLYLDGVGMDEAEMKAIVELASKYFVKVVPQVNMPAHMAVLLPSKPEYQLRNTDGTLTPHAIDLTNEEAVDWALGLIEKYIDIFPSDEWHLGSDEFPGWPGTGANHPQLDAYAKLKFGPDATFADLFADFQNRANDIVKAHGKKLRVWNDMIRQSEVVTLDRDVTVEYWIQHDALPGLLSAAEIARRGNPLINAYVDHLYYDQSRRNLDPRDIYENFDPNRYAWETDVPAQSSRGARMAVWLAWINTSMESDAEVLDNITPPMAALAQQVWGSPKLAETWTQFQAEVVSRIGEAPGQSAESANSIVANPAAGKNVDGTVAYFARDEEGALWTGKQSRPAVTHLSQHQIGSNVAGDPVVTTLPDGRLQVAARTEDSRLLIATQRAANAEAFETVTLPVRTSTDPALVAGFAVVNGNGKLMVVDISTGGTRTVIHQAKGVPAATLIDGELHLATATKRGMAYVVESGDQWRVTEDPTKLASTPQVLDVNGQPLIVTTGTDEVARSARIDGETLAWSEIMGEVAGQQASAIGGDGVAHVVARTTGNTVRHAKLNDGTWTDAEVGHHTTTDDPSLTVNSLGEPFIFFKYDNGMQVVGVPDGGGYATNVLAESTTGTATAITDSLDRPTYFVATTYGDLQTGTKWGNLWQWGRDFAIGTMAYPDDDLAPDQLYQTVFHDSFDSDTVTYRTLALGANEVAPAPTIGDGTLSVGASEPFFSTMVTDVPVSEGDTVVIASVDNWLENSRNQDTMMVGFVRDENNYSMMWVSHNANRIGFDTMSDGKLTTNGGYGNVPVVVEKGDRIAVVLTGKWMVGYVERNGVWHRVHTAIANGHDDLADPQVRAQYRYATALRGDAGTSSIGELTVGRR